MSSITGSCSESPSNLLFEQGVEQVQQRRLEEKNQQQEAAVSSSESANAITEGLKGSLFDAFA